MWQQFVGLDPGNELQLFELDRNSAFHVAVHSAMKCTLNANKLLVHFDRDECMSRPTLTICRRVGR